MFERYTEKARRVIFFARYEASQFGSPFIETEHLLLAVLREDHALAMRFLHSHAAIDGLRDQIESQAESRPRAAPTPDLPLSHECKRVLAYAAEESERLHQPHIGPSHLFLALLREKDGTAARLLRERGLDVSAVREELARSKAEPVPVTLPTDAPETEPSNLLTQLRELRGVTVAVSPPVGSEVPDYAIFAGPGSDVAQFSTPLQEIALQRRKIKDVMNRMESAVADRV